MHGGNGQDQSENLVQALKKIDMKKFLFYCMSLLLLSSCMTTLKINSVLNFENPKFEIKPFIINNEGEYYLRYKVKIDESGVSNRLQLSNTISEDSLFYYFVGYSSFREYEKPVNVKITDIKMLKCIKESSVYWVNPDNSRVPLKVEND